MAAGSANAADRGPGILIKNPTSVTAPGTDGAYGGTLLGLSRDHRWQMMDSPIMVPAEEYGGAPSEGVEGGKWCIFGALFRGWDADALAAIYANTSTGSSGKVINMGTGESAKAGHRLSDRAIKLLFVPDNTAKRAVIVYRALPVLQEDSATAFSIFREATHAVTFIGMPDATGRIAKVGVLGDLAV